MSAGVRRKLCALSLTARAQHGELPLPMPTILRRPTHMILVTGMTANGLNVQDTSHDEYLSPQRSSKRNSNGSESNQCGLGRLNSNRRFNGSSGSGINPSCKNAGTEEENRNLMAETRLMRSGPRTPRQVDSQLNIHTMSPTIFPLEHYSTVQFSLHLIKTPTNGAFAGDKCAIIEAELVRINLQLTNNVSLFICRSIRRAQNQQMRARLPSPPCPPAELPLPQTWVTLSCLFQLMLKISFHRSTLRSRRRLANILVAAGFIYMLCWLPHVCCLVIREFSINDGCSNTAKEFFMLLGEIHKFINATRCATTSCCFNPSRQRTFYDFNLWELHLAKLKVEQCQVSVMPTWDVRRWNCKSCPTVVLISIENFCANT